MFYSQIILAKKGPLGKVWLAAHWGDKKLGRKQVFSADIASSVDTIVNPAVPLALRVSGHLLLGVVRIYSHQVKFLMRDCEEAMVKIKLAFRPDGVDPKEDAQEYLEDGRLGGSANVHNFGDVSLMEQQLNTSGNALGIGGMSGLGLLVQPIPEDGTMNVTGGPASSNVAGNNTNMFNLPFDLLDVSENWIEDEGDVIGQNDDLTGSQNINAQERSTSRKAMMMSDTQDSSLMGTAVDNSALAAVNMTLDSEFNDPAMSMSQVQVGREEEEEEWHAFNPEDEEMGEDERHVFGGDKERIDEKDKEVDVTKDSNVSNIELVRGEEDQTSLIGRASVVGSEVNSLGTRDQMSIQERSQVSDNEFPINEEEEEVGGGFPFDSPDPTSNINASLLSPDALAENKRQSIAIDGLDADLSIAGTQNSIVGQQEQEQVTVPKKISPKGPKRRRKRRRIQIDNDASELTSDHMKQMLRDTSEITIQNRAHPADYEPSEEYRESTFDNFIPRRKRMKYSAATQRISSLSWERSLARPSIADDGALAPVLLQLWERNGARLRGEALPFRMRGDAGEEQLRQRAEDRMKSFAAKEAADREDEESIEIGRRDEESLIGSEGRLSLDIPPQEKMQEEDESEFPQPDDDDIPMPFDEQDDDLAQQQQDEAVDFADDMIGMASPARSEFSLGAVNDLEGDLEEEPRQQQGDDLISSSTKWHKHTVKVLNMLKRNMKSENEEDVESDKAKELSYDKLSYGTSRRTACGVFFELLQLKTWDVIELNQEASYGDIKIAPGHRFDDKPPTD